MDRKILILLISFIVAPSMINAQVVLNCAFEISGANYDCRLNSAFIADNENINVTFGGQHQPGMTNAQVTRILIANSLIPFVIPSIFTTFVNLREYSFLDSSFETRVQANAFANAQNIQEITIANTGGLTLSATGLSGATLLLRLNLQNNRIASLPNGIFNGLVNLTTVDISNNLIEVIDSNLLRAATQLTSLNVNNNNLKVLPNTLLATNNQLISLFAQSNQIHQIGRNFLDNLNELRTLSLSGNSCVNMNWTNIGLSGGPSKESVQESLSACFETYELRGFKLYLRGTLTIYDEDGNFVTQL